MITIDNEMKKEQKKEGKQGERGQQHQYSAGAAPTRGCRDVTGQIQRQIRKKFEDQECPCLWRLMS